MTTPAEQNTGCRATPWIQYDNLRLFRVPAGSAYVYATSHMAIDADGAPNAYAPDDAGLDALANAGFPAGNWQAILVPDPLDHGSPFVQASGPFAGFFVSQTALQDSSKRLTDPARYVDATAIPYIVFPGNFLKLPGTGTLGDVGLAFNLNNGKSTPFIVADVGPSAAELGEVSIKLAEALGGTEVNPRTGAGIPEGPTAYVVFPHSHATPKWPLSLGDLTTRAAAELARCGGAEPLLPCVR